MQHAVCTTSFYLSIFRHFSLLKTKSSYACGTAYFKLQKTCKAWHVKLEYKIQDMTIPDQSGKLYI